MSGICGVVTFDGQPAHETTVRAMADAAPHRGSGGTQLRCAAGVVLAEQRRAGAPGQRAAGTGTSGSPLVVIDARLDNGRELRAALARSGFLPPGPGDDQALIAAAYEAWGAGCPGRLVGDFAFVLWDPRRRLLLAARDPLGMRSLFLHHEHGRRLLFATEVKQLLAAPEVPARIHEAAVAADLVAQFGRSDWSFYDGISQLAPGRSLVVDARGVRSGRFWDVDPGHRVGSSPHEAASLLRSTFTESVASRLRDPRPTGVLLSGGVDSGSVASVAGWLLERGQVETPSLHAFSWAFDRLRECDERHVSRHVVDRFGLTATDVPADDAGPLACYPEHLPDRDDPMLGAFQPLIEHALAAARGQGVGVLLGGDRGDLVIGDVGVSYLRMAQARRWRDLVRALAEHRRVTGDPAAVMARRHLVAAVAARVGRRSPRQWARRGVRRVTGRGRPHGSGGYPEWVNQGWLRSTGAGEGGASEVAVPDGLDLARQERYRWIFTPLHVRGVAWSERTYARHGLGFADPFSDRRLVELAVALPQALVNRPGDYSKPLMRAAMAGVMPDAAVAAARKILPRPLYDDGLRREADLVRALLVAPQVQERGWVDGRLLREHFERWLGGAPLRAEFWWTLQVELWLRQHWT